MSFVHLHVHSDHSGLDSTARVRDIVAKAADMGHPAIAITDHGDLSGLFEAFDEGRKRGIKVIAGLEAYLAIGSRHEQNYIEVPADDVDTDSGDETDGRMKRKRYHHITVLAESETGWRNLVAMHNESINSMWGKHRRIDYELLKKHAEGLIVLTGCLGGPVLGPLAQVTRSRVTPLMWNLRSLAKKLDEGKKAIMTPLRKLKRAYENLDWAGPADHDHIHDLLDALRSAEISGGKKKTRSRLTDAIEDLDAAIKTALASTDDDNKAIAGARTGIESLINAVGSDNVYVEVMEHGIPQESAALPLLADLADEYDLPLVATNDSHYIEPGGGRAHEAWLALQTGKKLTDPASERFTFTGEGYHLRTEEEMRELRSEDWWQEACDNTTLVADRIADTVTPEVYLRLPTFPLPDGWDDSRKYLVHLVKQGAERLWGDPMPEEVRARLNTEMKVIAGFGVIDYFLIVHDLIAWARSQGIKVGPGRGCLVGDDLVWTTDGYKKLRDVQVGDTVRTHTGALRPVVNTMRYECDEPLYEIRSYSDGRGATMTGDHRVLVVRAERETDKRKLAQGYRFSPVVSNRPEWVQAQDVEAGDFVLSPRPSSPGTAPAVIDVAPLLPPPPSGVEYRVTDDEIVEVVPINKPYPHSVRDVSKKTGMSRNTIQGILATSRSFEDAPAVVVRRDSRAERMRDRLVGTLRSRGFHSLAEYRSYLGRNTGSARYEHAATTVAREAGVNNVTLHKILRDYPDTGAIAHNMAPSQAAMSARRTLANELRSRGFASFSEWNSHISRNATYEVRTPRFVSVNNDLVFILGAWASNGWLRADSPRVVGWAERGSTADDTIPRLIHQLWGLHVTEMHSTSRDLVQYEVRSAAVRALFRHLASEYELTAQTKHLPPWVCDLDETGKRALLGGLWWGDGSVAGGRWQYSTSSPRLAHQVRDLLWAVGAPAGMDEDNRVDERDEFANTSVSWRIGTTPDFKPAVMQFGWTDDNYVYQRVRNVNAVAPAGEVFDIEVPVDHSYMTDSYVVHNSAAGSAVSYALDIVKVDPLRYDLLFERFLDPTRVGMPDIDIDFEQGRRDEVFAYLADKYGFDHVARIGTFQMSKTKAAIKSAARVLGYTASYGETLSKAVPLDGPTPYPFAKLDATAETDASGFWAQVNEDDRGPKVIELARQFEDVVTGLSIHACGVVVSDEPLTDLIPLRKDTRGADGDPLITEWDADGVEEGVGLLKLDVLGLRNLDIVAAAERGVKDLTGETVELDDLPDPDDIDNGRVRKAWELIASGQTEGVFQLESQGMQELAQDVQPMSLEHASALVALYRPGPLSAGMNLDYAARKNGRAEISYDAFTTDPDEQAAIATVLEPTYGTAVYQEQYMLLGDVVAGFGPAERNRLRKAVSRKIRAEVDAVGELFLKGAMSDVAMDGSPKLAFKEETAIAVWHAIEGGAEYVFNKSHSAAYGQLSYATAFLKANWPAAYGAALLTITTKDKDRRRHALNSLADEGIEVQAPSVNTSGTSSTAVSDTVVTLGLGEIRDVGKAAEHIVAEREKNGPFTSAGDILERVTTPGKDGATSKLTTRVIQALIEAGACDDFGPRKGQIRSLFALRKRPDTTVMDEEWGAIERSIRQHHRLGIMTGEHPIKAVRDQIKGWSPPVRDDEYRPLSRKSVPVHKIGNTDRSFVSTVGLVTGWDVKPDNRGGRRAQLQLEGSKGHIEAMVWNNTLRTLKPEPGVGTVTGLTARVRSREIEQEDEEGNIQIQTVRSLSVVDMFPIDITEPGATTTEVILGIDLASATYSPDRPMLTVIRNEDPKPKASSTKPRPPSGPGGGRRPQRSSAQPAKSLAPAPAEDSAEKRTCGIPPPSEDYLVLFPCSPRGDHNPAHSPFSTSHHVSAAWTNINMDPTSGETGEVRLYLAERKRPTYVRPREDDEGLDEGEKPGLILRYPAGLDLGDVDPQHVQDLAALMLQDPDGEWVETSFGTSRQRVMVLRTPRVYTADDAVLSEKADEAVA